ncbi:MAG TPA: 1-deoxy-D-xylulose-5-phosphate synthase [Nocardioides sp.]|jgi:1-deoxy-D-xylulose-5-phosphate synthase|uniref:1-deoxy-D-xylulose-5-phosphate synthase n=1 Tax=Nocardioides sp. TaxID=35761 RepID=UPI002E35D0F9|nr:1-deoxy-D-xylulose-5-phosphate synthase [Nocardioides sp.]HEX3930864.1 1-deoxy-D-xylulose-5-phosphate synthase [Nocardioides sp.]
MSVVETVHQHLGHPADGSLLAGITCPDDVRRVPVADLPRLAAEIRAELVDTVTAAGGHLGSNLGVVELTLVLHRVFRSPRDAIVWDTGHQSYVHKLLTGRREAFATLRRRGGLSGYPSRAESVHDLVENSHASTSLSYADGLAKGFRLTGAHERRVVAVIGDGALTGGMAWEALNNLGAAPDRPVVVVLNDNGRSYDPTAGRLPAHLTELREGTAGGNLFEELGLAYVGPFDGHDVEAVECGLRAAAALHHTVVVHVVTRKGEGYPAAELDEADRLHTVPPTENSHRPCGPAWTSVFAEELERLGEERADLVAVTAAMTRPTGLHPFALRFPDRVFDVGIAEQHAVTSAVGLATAGLHPVVAIYATFLNRAFDQVLMDAALHRAPVTFVLDRAGVTGPDGASHHGIWDIALFGLVPGARLAAPRDAVRLRELLGECVAYDGPTALRFPRGTAIEEIPARDRWGTADVLAIGSATDVLVVAAGPLAEPALDAAAQLEADGIGTTVVDPRWLLPLEPELVARAASYRVVVTVEDGAPSGGFGEQVARALRTACCGRGPAVRCMALPERSFVPAGGRGELLHEHGIEATGIAAAARMLVALAATPSESDGSL